MEIHEINTCMVEMLQKGCSSRDLLRVAAHHRRMDLERNLQAELNGIIALGPFKGLKASWRSVRINTITQTTWNLRARNLQ